jgi:hypothetical protein
MVFPVEIVGRKPAQVAVHLGHDVIERGWVSLPPQPEPLGYVFCYLHFKWNVFDGAWVVNPEWNTGIEDEEPIN